MVVIENKSNNTIISEENQIQNNSTKQIVSSNSLPKFIYFILINDFGERFCFYGIKTILFQYMKIGYGLNDVESKIQVHLFGALVYMFPLFGAMISDSYLSKYKTVVLFSLIYWLGNFLLSIFSINNLLGEMGNLPFWFFILSSILIAIGAGGIKPSVASHAGDQIPLENTRLVDRLFSMLHFIAMIGSLIASYLSPAIIANVECFGSPCYFLAYMISCIMFGITIVLFIVGRKYYVVVPPIGEFLPFKCLKLSILALRRYIQASPSERSSKKAFLSFAEQEYGPIFVEETRLFFKVMILLFPLMFFWLLYDQAFTEWQNQYKMMNKMFFGKIYISTEASANINVVLLIVLIPLMTDVVYHFFKRIGQPLSVINRMIIGYAFVILAFIISNCLTYSVLYYSKDNLIKEKNVQVSCEGCLNGTWQLPQWFFLSLGETMLCVTAVQFAYTQVGPMLKASSTAVYVLNVAFGNYIVSGIEEGMVLAGFDSPTIKQWIFIAISTFFFLVFVLLAKFWYISKEDEDLLKENNQTEFLHDLKHLN